MKSKHNTILKNLIEKMAIFNKILLKLNNSIKEFIAQKNFIVLWWELWKTFQKLMAGCRKKSVQ